MGWKLRNSPFRFGWFQLGAKIARNLLLHGQNHAAPARVANRPRGRKRNRRPRARFARWGKGEAMNADLCIISRIIRTIGAERGRAARGAPRRR